MFRIIYKIVHPKMIYNVCSKSMALKMVTDVHIRTHHGCYGDKATYAIMGASPLKHALAPRCIFKYQIFNYFPIYIKDFICLYVDHF